MSEDANGVQAEEAVVASMYRMQCPKCGSGDLTPVKTEGSMGQLSGLFGAVGNIIADRISRKSLETECMNYKCESCKNKFVSHPLVAQPDELLEEPCIIQFTRLSSPVGIAVSQIVYLNGMKVGPVKNKQSLTIQTSVRYNTMFVTDQHGLVFKGVHKFEAQPGGNVQVNFKRKFVD